MIAGVEYDFIKEFDDPWVVGDGLLFHSLLGGEPDGCFFVQDGTDIHVGTLEQVLELG